MSQLTATEFARNPGKVFDRLLATGEPIEITRHGQPIARLVPCAPRRTLTGREFVAALARIAEEHPEPDPTFLADCRSASPEEDLDSLIR
ncbi:MAG: type II toxin-antitoxin system Phd/YefM family antitoxin [Casimicrobiaceae bacterium]|nr:type II toxin-antitoxin system Phd/YefM family antitoxin [Casimicrobiaceae bacterium]